MVLTVFKQLYGLENRYMALKTVIWPYMVLTVINCYKQF